MEVYGLEKYRESFCVFNAHRSLIYLIRHRKAHPGRSTQSNYNQPKSVLKADKSSQPELVTLAVVLQGSLFNVVGHLPDSCSMPTKASNTTILVGSFGTSVLIAVLPTIRSLSKEHRLHSSSELACLGRCPNFLALVLLLTKRILTAELTLVMILNIQYILALCVLPVLDDCMMVELEL